MTAKNIGMFVDIQSGIANKVSYESGQNKAISARGDVFLKFAVFF